MYKFNEEQKFRQWWVGILMTGFAFVPLYGIYQQLIMGEPFGDKPMSNLVLFLFSFLTFGIITLFYSIQLKTEINKFELRFAFLPFYRRSIKWEDVESAKVISYVVLGYGVKFGSKYGTVFNIAGNKGLAIKLKNGKKLLIGTQKHIELSEAVKGILNEQSIEN